MNLTPFLHQLAHLRNQDFSLACLWAVPAILGNGGTAKLFRIGKCQYWFERITLSSRVGQRHMGMH